LRLEHHGSETQEKRKPESWRQIEYASAHYHPPGKCLPAGAEKLRRSEQGSALLNFELFEPPINS